MIGHERFNMSARPIGCAYLEQMPLFAGNRQKLLETMKHLGLK
jgi:hypothetical protein